MPRRILSLAACLALLSPAALAQTDAQFVQSLQPLLKLSGDGRYKLAEKRAHQALDILKTLRDYANDVKDGSERLRKEMLGSKYEDWVNTRLSPLLFETR